MTRPRSQRCSASSKRSGQRCRRWAILGGTVCPSHGGAAPQVQAAAVNRLYAMQHPALDVLHGVLTSATATDADKVRTALGVLDRTGLGPSSYVELDAQASVELGMVEHLTDDQLLQLITTDLQDPDHQEDTDATP